MNCCCFSCVVGSCDYGEMESYEVVTCNSHFGKGFIFTEYIKCFQDYPLIFDKELN